MSQRVDQAFCMTVDSFWLFGSGLYKAEPRDLDVLVLFHATPEQKTEYEEHIRSHMSWDFVREGRERKTSLILRKGLKNIDLHFAFSLEESSLATTSLLLVWSREKPNVAQNLADAGYGCQIVRLLGTELVSLRQQLKMATEEVRVSKQVFDTVLSRLPEEDVVEIVCSVLYGVTP